MSKVHNHLRYDSVQSGWQVIYFKVRTQSRRQYTNMFIWNVRTPRCDL